jgi:integrative and conjugative element protein (TIGR02256 family)
VNEGQRRALDELHGIAEAVPGAIEVVDVVELADGIVRASVSIDCRGIKHDETGIRIRARERFGVRIPTSFPFKPPSVYATHVRWRGAPHVQWGSYLCLYRSLSTEWHPADGMYGFLERLLEWLQAASLGELDPIGGPQHPPVAYSTGTGPMFIPRVNTPLVDTGADWVGFALLDSRSDYRKDIIDWIDIKDVVATVHTTGQQVALTILLNGPMPWEYPKRLSSLFLELLDHGIGQQLLFHGMQLVASLNGDEDVYVVLGTPMRGTVGEELSQHLTAWRLARTDVGRFEWTLATSDDDADADAQKAAFRAFVDWSTSTNVEWCQVREARPEVTHPRDSGSPLQHWAGKQIEVWGCGALGGRVAESLARAGARTLVLCDNSTVSPGLLVRQNFEDQDIGAYKVSALARRLRAIAPEIQIVERRGDLVASEAGWSHESDAVFDLTASPSVRARVEQTRRGVLDTPTSFVGMTIGHHATRGLVVIAPAAASGGPTDITRKAKLAASRAPQLREFAEEFWPIDSTRLEVFQPEPGCSDATFTGSDAEVSALASAMLIAASAAAAAGKTAMQATFVALPQEASPGLTHRLDFQDDLILPDPISGYEVRIEHNALAEMRAWTRESERRRPRLETGGILFGERDDAVGVIWVSDLLGPPPDSTVSPLGFTCGSAGVVDASRAIRHRSRDASRPIGVWHTHPNSAPIPSETDRRGMREVIDDLGAPQPTSLLVIVGGSESQRQLGAYVYRRGSHNQLRQHDVRRLEPARSPDHKIGLALSGGGFRAIAFHLGVLRALQDREVLDKIDVISSVSGGSLISAMWAYGPEDFAEFDAQAVELLRRGLTAQIARRALLSHRLPQAVGTTLAAAAGSLAATVKSVSYRAVGSASGRRRATNYSPHVADAVNRTSAFADTLETLVDARLAETTRDVHVIINACDLRSGSAFRFGSGESGCTRYGTLQSNDVPVALAVAASAAYPVFLPAIDRSWTFEHRDGTSHEERVLLTDGGVFDNLGTSCLEPGRNPLYSTNVHPVDYIITADAGRGLLDADAYPLFWPARMKRSVESLYRKVQDGGKGDLFLHRTNGALRGLAMPFLGQVDGVLPIRPSNLVPRETVVNYPTDFAAMSADDLARLTLRGEQLTRLVIEHHCPDIT